jgi:Patatin phospholipase
MREHWQSGYEDTKRTLKRKEWLTMPPAGSGIVVHDVHREEVPWLRMASDELRHDARRTACV